jgi:hypothetical protein
VAPVSSAGCASKPARPQLSTPTPPATGESLGANAAREARGCFEGHAVAKFGYMNHMTTHTPWGLQDSGSEDWRNVEDEKIPYSWVGQRIDLVTLDANPGTHTEIEGEAIVYDLGVRHISGLRLTSVTEQGIVVESTFLQADSMRVFHPWGSVLRIFLSR